MAPMKSSHAMALSLADQQLRSVFQGGYVIRVQMPLRLAHASEPEPDLAVVQGAPRDFTEHPSSAILVVEISDTTLAFDRGEKASLYASAGIADYWLVNLINARVHVHRRPVPDPASAYGYRYADVTAHAAGASITPLAVPAASIAVAQLLP